MEYGKIEPATKGTVRQEVKIHQGIPVGEGQGAGQGRQGRQDQGPGRIQGDQLRVSGKSKDDLQEVIALLKKNDQGMDLQFTNYRG